MEASVIFVGTICRYGSTDVLNAGSRSVGVVAKTGCNVAYNSTEDCK